MTEIIIMACILGITFGMGMYMGARMERQRRRRRGYSYYTERGPLRPIANPDPQFDEEYWVRNPPPFPMGGSAGERSK